MSNRFKQDNGVAGLTILLSLVVMLFIIGLIVMIFALMGGELREATYDELTSVSVSNETVTGLTNSTGAGDTLAGGSYRDAVCTVTLVKNATSGATVPASNYSMTNCLIKAVDTSLYVGSNVKVDYSYTWSADNTATDVMNETVAGISTTTDWFDIFVVIGAMVVMILLTVIIITAIKGSGMIGSTQQGANTVGTA